MTTNPDNCYYVLLAHLVKCRDERVRTFEDGNFPIRITRRRRYAIENDVRALAFRYKNREIKRPTLQFLKSIGAPYKPGMLRLIGEIARLDELIAAMIRKAHQVVTWATAICVKVVQACERYHIYLGQVLTPSSYEFAFAGAYTPLPFAAREIALRAIGNALEAASERILACNRERRWSEKKKRHYSPHACPGLLIRSRNGVLPPYAEWGFFIRRNPEKHYRFVRRLTTKRRRTKFEIATSPTLLQLRYFKMKSHAATFREIGAFVTEIMHIRNRHRRLWEFVRSVPIPKRDTSLLMASAAPPIDEAPHE